ncbi:deoxyribodipyrimidine photo-lyase, partial [Francisella tularensis subsp. holarctica]|nr:deoxyribodipyrimidine photo-lyase [Francisella tularensis subsp. holarctica]
SHQILEEFLDNKVKEYKTARDFIRTDSTSKLSPYLHFGEISPNQIFNDVQSLDYIGNNEEHFIKELVWRDFSFYQIYYYPELHYTNINQ